MDTDIILTVLNAPADCAELIRALAAEVRDLREGRGMLCASTAKAVRELGEAQIERDAALDRLDDVQSERDAALERLAVLEAADHAAGKASAARAWQLPGPGSSLDDMLRYAEATQTKVRVTVAKPGVTLLDATVECVPRYWAENEDDTVPWELGVCWCGVETANDQRRIIAVELL